MASGSTSTTRLASLAAEATNKIKYDNPFGRNFGYLPALSANDNHVTGVHDFRSDHRVFRGRGQAGTHEVTAVLAWPVTHGCNKRTPRWRTSRESFQGSYTKYVRRPVLARASPPLTIHLLINYLVVCPHALGAKSGAATPNGGGGERVSSARHSEVTVRDDHRGRICCVAGREARAVRSRECRHGPSTHDFVSSRPTPTPAVSRYSMYLGGAVGPVDETLIA